MGDTRCSERMGDTCCSERMGDTCCSEQHSTTLRDNIARVEAPPPAALPNSSLGARRRCLRGRRLDAGWGWGSHAEGALVGLLRAHHQLRELPEVNLAGAVIVELTHTHQVHAVSGGSAWWAETIHHRQCSGRLAANRGTTAGWVSMLLLQRLRNAVQPPGSRRLTLSMMPASVGLSNSRLQCLLRPTLNSATPSRVAQHLAIGRATERSAATRLVRTHRARCLRSRRRRRAGRRGSARTGRPEASARSSTGGRTQTRGD